MEVGTYHFTYGLKYDMDVYMVTLFGGETHDLCVEGWVWETMALRTFTTVDLFYLITCEDPHDLIG